MEAKDKLGSLRSLAQIHRGQFDERHRYEWKIIFTILSFYVLSAALSCKKGTALPTGTWFHWTVWISFITLAALSSVFLAFIHVANHKNISIAENA
ncbi:hypothetical protein KA005_81640, partial [bacterium]|nr:hypothetical protein [bacterium]